MSYPPLARPQTELSAMIQAEMEAEQRKLRDGYKAVFGRARYNE